MVSTHYHGLIGDSHTKGAVKSNSSSYGPVVLGVNEQKLGIYDPISAHSFAEGDIIEQVVPVFGVAGGVSLRARVIKVLATGVLGSIIVETVAADASGASPWPGLLPGSEDKVWAWDTYDSNPDPLPESSPNALAPLGLDVNVNGAAVNLHISNYYNSQLIEQLNDPALSKPTTDSVYWDPIAHKARSMEINNYTNTVTSNILMNGDQITCSGGGVIIVNGVDYRSADSTATVYFTQKRGNSTAPATGNTMVNNQALRALGGTVTVTSVGAATTPGAFVPYCATPSLGRTISGQTNDLVANIWQIPPRGNAGTLLPSIGPEARYIERAVSHYAERPDENDRGFRYIQHSSNDFRLAGQSGFDAGVAFQKVYVTGLSGTWALGVPVTSSGTWAGVVVGSGAASGDTYVYVYGTNGFTLASGETLTSGTGSATATGPAMGWRKGSAYYNDFKAQVEAAALDPNAEHNSQTATWDMLNLMIWEGEIAPIADANVGNTIYAMYAVTAYQQVIRQQWVDFATEIRAELSSPNMILQAWVHHEGAQITAQSGGANVLVRATLAQLSDYVPKFMVADSTIRGHKMQLDESGSNNPLFLRTMDYLDLGTYLWNGTANVTITAPIGNFSILPVGVISGSQSQMHGFGKYSLWSHDLDPELWSTASFAGPISDTTDPNGLTWNHQTKQLETYDVNLNENTFFENDGVTSTFGPCPSLMQRMKMRYGSSGSHTLSSDTVNFSGKFCLFKASVSGSALNPFVMTSPGCWQPSLSSRPASTGTITVTHSGTTAILTASEFFSSYTANTTMTVVISGSGGVQGAGGIDSKVFGSSDLFSITSGSARVTDTNGDFIDGVYSGVTFTFGPPPLWPEMEAQWKLFIRGCLDAGYIPRPVFLGQEQGESDIQFSADYATYLNEFWTAFEDLCGLREDKKDCGIAKFIIQLHRYTPLAALQSDILKIRGHQETKAGTLSDCVLIDPSPLPLESAAALDGGSSPPYPRHFRLENGVHHTDRAMVTKGYMIDEALGGLSSLIPSHPNGSAGGIAFGAVNGTGRAEVVLT
jgi:hypothetical protein